MEAIEQLIEDYRRRLKSTKSFSPEKNPITKVRLETKASCYRTIITELERVLEVKN
jgi:transposase